MKILIAGQAKSGTTALYYAIKQSLPAEYNCLFEPNKYPVNDPHECVLAKILINGNVNIEDFNLFQKKILLVRDPRDNLVSRLLYSVYDLRFSPQDILFKNFLKKLSEKQKSPSSVSLIELLSLLNDLSGTDIIKKIINRQKMALDFDARHSDCFVYKYEDFVRSHIKALEEFLNFKLKFNGQVDLVHDRVTRIKGSGDWKNWFTVADVNYFQDIYRSILSDMGIIRIGN